MNEAKINYTVNASEVLTAIFDLDYRLPGKDVLSAKFQEHGILPLVVESAAKPDFTASDLDSFLDYITAGGVQAVMFRYEYYTPQDVTDTYKLSENDRAFFFVRIPPYTGSGYSSYYRQAYEQRERENPSNSDLKYYRMYTKYIETAVDLTIPRALELYAMHEGKVIACVLKDDWLERLPLPNARTIRNECANIRSYSGYGDGMLSFVFNYDFAKREDEIDAAAALSAGDREQFRKAVVTAKPAEEKDEPLTETQKAMRDMLENLQKPASQRAETPAAESQTEEKPAAEAQTEEKPAAEAQTEEKPAAESQTEEKPAAESQTEEKPAAESQTAEKPAAESQTAEKPASDYAKKKSRKKRNKGKRGSAPRS